MISILILTKNEEKDLPGCLESVKWSDDIHVYDSLSTDKTVEIAKAAGAKVTSRAFDNWSSHQNWGLKNIQFKHEWVFYIDADERMTPELVAGCKNAINNPNGVVAFQVQRRDFYLDTWLKHVQTSPFYLRLFQPSKMRYERLVNPISIPDGPTANVSGYLNHYPFSKGIDHWLDRHNSYSRFEAMEIFAGRRTAPTGQLFTGIFSRDFHERRANQKALFYKLPFRPLIKFIILYIMKRGFLDGKAGLSYAMLQSFYEYMIVLKVEEMKKSPPPAAKK